MSDRHFRQAALDSIHALNDYKGLTYLELGCGDGFVMEALAKEGISVKGTTYRAREQDYIRTREHPNSLVIDYGIDLNEPLPYADASFDVVYSTEVIEHIESHRMFISEASRVLRDGGFLIITTPNIHRLLSRLQFALSGTHHTKQELIPWDYPLSRMEEFHHRCVDFPLFHWLLWQNKLRIQKIGATEVKLVSWAALIFKPVSAIFSRRAVFRHQSNNPEDRAARRDLVKWMNDAALLSSEQMCVTAQKQA